jgi:enamine deaminase RidA (YjgF/YER057c/UK114 family)
MDRPVTGGGPASGPTPHRLINPPTLASPRGFTHVVVPEEGRTIYLSGLTGHDAHDRLVQDGLVAQFDAALANVVRALDAAGARPEHLVSVQIYVTNVEGYRSSLPELGEAWRRHLGKHYPAVALLEVAGLFDEEAAVELSCIAVIPEGA